VKRDGARFELLQISYRFVSPRSSCRFSTIFTDIHLHGGPAPVRRYLPELNGTINLGDVFDLQLPAGSRGKLSRHGRVARHPGTAAAVR
jgi:hypothetical protein